VSEPPAVSSATATSILAVPSNPDAYVPTCAVASFLSLDDNYLRQLRLTGNGPRFSKFGRAVRYRMADVLAWAESRSVNSTSQMEVAA
jgi:predicted DNA-binding transcriptional regulator AlpA